jgi:hypothetical protein
MPAIGGTYSHGVITFGDPPEPASVLSPQEATLSTSIAEPEPPEPYHLIQKDRIRILALGSGSCNKNPFIYTVHL